MKKLALYAFLFLTTAAQAHAEEASLACDGHRGEKARQKCEDTMNYVRETNAQREFERGLEPKDNFLGEQNSKAVHRFAEEAQPDAATREEIQSQGDEEL